MAYKVDLCARWLSYKIIDIIGSIGGGNTGANEKWSGLLGWFYCNILCIDE